MNQENERKNPFFEPYNTPHDTAPFDRIRLEDFEEAFTVAARESHYDAYEPDAGNVERYQEMRTRMNNLYDQVEPR